MGKAIRGKALGTESIEINLELNFLHKKLLDLLKQNPLF